MVKGQLGVLFFLTNGFLNDPICNCSVSLLPATYLFLSKAVKVVGIFSLSFTSLVAALLNVPHADGHDRTLLGFILSIL